MSIKLREALDKIRTLCKTELEYCIDPSNVVDEILDIANSALAEPLKNYEVGTLEEQAGRWHNFCDNAVRKDCPETTCRTCSLYWSQMPYEPL